MMGIYRKGDPGENGIDYGVYRRVEARSGMEKRCGMWYVAVDILKRDSSRVVRIGKGPQREEI